MTSRIVFLISCAVIAMARLDAQTLQTSPPPERYYSATQGLTLQQAIATALEHEPSLRAVRTDVDAARGSRLQADVHPNPTVSFEQRFEPGGTDKLTSVVFEWPLDLYRKSARVAAGDLAVATAQLSVADRERLLAAETRTQFGELLVAIRDLMVIDSLVQTARRQQNALRARVDEGAAPPLERNLLEIDLRRLEAERLAQTGRADVAVVRLKRLLGMPPTAELTVRETLEDVVLREMQAGETAKPAETDSDGIAQRADVREAETRIRLAEARVDSTRSEGRYDMSVVGSYMRMDSGFPQRGFGPTGSIERVHGIFQYFAAGVMVTLPWRNTNAGATAAAEAERLRAAAERDAVVLEARAELAAARARHAAAQQALALYRTETRQLARQNLDVMSQTYELGRATVFEVLAEQRRLAEFERTYTEVLREAYDTRTALDLATGVIR
jgi:cobalt-zinc-cadmium efflux system outer membrane protein